MKTAGIVCEYNPFHEGHRYHIEETRRRTGADGVICVMSGNFVQRGEPAVLEKKKRVQAALEGGADLVAELPFVYACSGAESFADGAVQLLTATGIIDVLSFGCEYEDTATMRDIAKVLNDEPSEFVQYLRGSLDAGNSFAVSRQEALINTMCTSGKYSSSDLKKIIKSPNCILGIEYIKALEKYCMTGGRRIETESVLRVGSAHGSMQYADSFPCASAIRSAMSPEDKDIDGLDSFSQAVSAILRRMTAAELALYPDMEEGLANRIIRASENYAGLSDIVKAVSSKRYSAARIRRILMYVLTGLTDSDRKKIYSEGIQYIRVLGFNDTGRTMLASMRKNASVPVFTRGKDIRKYCADCQSRIFEYECIAGDQYTLVGCGDINTKRRGGELRYVPVKV